MGTRKQSNNTRGDALINANKHNQDIDILQPAITEEMCRQRKEQCGILRNSVHGLSGRKRLNKCSIVAFVCSREGLTRESNTRVLFFQNATQHDELQST